jgi:hypothetical protein
VHLVLDVMPHIEVGKFNSREQGGFPAKAHPFE